RAAQASKLNCQIAPAWQYRLAMDKRVRQLSRGYGAVFATIGIWSLPSLFQFYLNRFYDPWSQNFYRYAVACLAIAPFVFYHLRRSGPKIDMSAIGLCL